MRVKSAARNVLVTAIAGLGIASGSQAATLAEVYELAIENDPEIAAAEASYMARREVVTQARSGLLPNVSATASTTDNKTTSPELTPNPSSPSGFDISSITQTYNSNSWSAILTQPVFDLASWFRFQQSQDIEAQALAQFTDEQQNLIFRVADTYLTVLEAQDRLGASIAARDAVQRQLEQVQQRFDVGLVAITDVLESTAAYDSAMVTVIESQGLQVISFETLLRLTGQQIHEVNSLADDFPVRLPEPRDENAWVDAALQNNYSLVAAQEAVDSAHRALHIAKSGHAPTVDARVIYNESESGSSGVFSGKTESTQASLTLNVPIFASFGTTSRRKQAGYELEQAQSNLDLARRTVVENTRSLYTAITTSVARVNARLKGIESSQSALDATQTGYEVGTRNIVDVLQAQQRLYEAQFQYASARYQYIRDTLRLKQVVGTLSPEDIYALNEYVVDESPVNRSSTSTVR